MKTQKIIHFIKALVIPLAIICLILVVLLLNQYLIDLVGTKSISVNENKLVGTPTSQNLTASLVQTFNQNENISPDDDITVLNLENQKTDAKQVNNLVEKYFSDTSDNKLGVNIHWAAREESCRDVLINDAIYQGKIQYVREEFNWDLIEASPGEKDYSRYDEIMESYQHYDVKVLGLLAYSTDWASTAPASANDKEFYPPNTSAWNNYVASTVKRYHGQVHAWEVWNEPNDPNFFKGSQTQYFTLLKNTYQTIKSIDPDAIVLNGGVTWPDSNYFQNFYAQGMGAYVDAIAVHAYYSDSGIEDGAYQKLADDLAQIIDLAQKNQQQIWITEFSSSSFPIGEKKQADNLAYLMTMFNQSLSIARVYWYALRDTDNTGKEGHYGLITRDYRLKQAFQAFQYFTR